MDSATAKNATGYAAASAGDLLKDFCAVAIVEGISNDCASCFEVPLLQTLQQADIRKPKHRPYHGQHIAHHLSGQILRTRWACSEA